MRFAFTEQQLELRGAVRHVLERECTAADVRSVAEEGPARGAGRAGERWDALAEMGATGLLVPESMGGVGLSEVEMVGILEEAGWAGLPEPLAETAVLGAPAIVSVARRAPKETAARSNADRWLAPIAEGRATVGVGGADVAAPGHVPTSQMLEDGPAGTLRTPRVAGALGAAVHVLCSASDSGWEVHAVPGDRARASATPSIDGTRNLGAVEWRPEPETVVATGEHAEQLVGELADHGAFAAAAQLCGLADRMIAMGADYAKTRRQFGRAIGSFQAVKHQLADARVRLEFARPAVYRAADSLARGVPDRAEHCSMAKALASDAADLAGRAALQVHGAIGYTWEADLHLFMKRAWSLSAAWGDAATHRALVLANALARTAPPRP